MKLKTAFLPALALALALPALTSPARAQAVAGAPAFVDYQGVVFDGTTTSKPLGSVPSTPTTDPVTYVAAPTNYTMQFKIYDAQSGGTLIWAETQTVTVSLGAFAVRLGSGASISGLSPTPTQTSIGTAFNGKDRFLELTVIVPPASTGTPITPRLAFQSSPFSLVAQRAVLADTATLANTATLASSVNGVVTATAGSTFTGNGAGLTGLTAGQIPSLDAGKITTGIFATARIPDLNASKITAGTLPIARGGTGSSTQNFVDLSNTQTIGGVKRFSSNVNIGTRSPNSKLDVQGNVTIGEGYGGYSDIAAPANGMIVQGNVGIGTTAPIAPLDVRGWTLLTRNYAWFIRGATTNSVQTGINNNAQAYSIVAEQSILAHQFCSTSDARIKDGVSASDIRQDLATIQQLRVKDYRMVDKVGLGNGLKKGFIAQEVEQVIPEAVTMGTEFVPDVYALASSVKWNAANQNLALTMPKAHGLKVGDRVRLSADDTTLVLNVVSVPSALEMVLGECKKEVELVFVFGKQVLDFRTVNYDRIFTTGIGAIQQIKKEKDTEMKALQDDNADLRSKLAAQDKRLTELEAKDKARDAKMASIEKLLESPDQPATRTISLKQGE